MTYSDTWTLYDEDDYRASLLTDEQADARDMEIQALIDDEDRADMYAEYEPSVYDGTYSEE